MATKHVTGARTCGDFTKGVRKDCVRCGKSKEEHERKTEVVTDNNMLQLVEGQEAHMLLLIRSWMRADDSRAYPDDLTNQEIKDTLRNVRSN